MVAVKGSKQYQMVVVRYRPWYQAMLTLVVLSIGIATAGLAFKYGRDEGLALEVEAVKERDDLRDQLRASREREEELSQQMAVLELGGEIDDRANEEVRLTVENLQQRIAELQEEIRFYKGVMLPNVENKGLRIERFNANATVNPQRIKYSLLLTQVVDKHEYIQGAVQLNLTGLEGNAERSIPFAQLNGDADNTVRFRFRYFQNIDGEITIPDGFRPREIVVNARTTGRNAHEVERRFDWQIRNG